MTPAELRAQWDAGEISAFNASVEISAHADCWETIRDWLLPFEAGHRVRTFFTRFAISRSEAERYGQELVRIGNGPLRNHPNLVKALMDWVDAGCP